MDANTSAASVVSVAAPTVASTTVTYTGPACNTRSRMATATSSQQYVFSTPVGSASPTNVYLPGTPSVSSILSPSNVTVRSQSPRVRLVAMEPRFAMNTSPQNLFSTLTSSNGVNASSVGNQTSHVVDPSITLVLSMMQQMEERRENERREMNDRRDRERREIEERIKREKREADERRDREKQEIEDRIKRERRETEERMEREERRDKERREAEVKRDELLTSALREIREQSTLSNRDQSFVKVKSVKMPEFDEKTDIDSFLLQFERIATNQGWPTNEWATRLATLLKGKAAEVYAQLPLDQSEDYQALKLALLAKYKLNAETYRRRFRTIRKDTGETFAQMIVRMTTLLKRWICLAGKTADSYKDLEDLILYEQLLNVSGPELELFLRQNDPKNVTEAAVFADRFVAAKNATKDVKTGFKSNHGVGKTQTKEKVEDAKVTDNKKLACFECGKGHMRRDCPQWIKRKASEQRSNFARACPLTVTQELNSICSNDRDFFHPVQVEGKPVLALRDTGSSHCIVGKEWVPLGSQTVGKVEVQGWNGLIDIVPEVFVSVNSPFFSGKIRASVCENPAAALIIGNTVTFSNGTKKSVQVFPQVVTAAVQTRAGKRREAEMPKPLKKTSEHVLSDPQEVRELQQKDPSLSLYRELAEKSETNQAKFFYKKGLLYRKYIRSGVSISQLIVPEALRKTALKIAHDSPMAGHQGIRRTTDRLLQSFYWPGIHGSVKNYCRSCDECQKTEPRGRTRKVHLGRMPIIGEPFERVAVDIIGPVTPISEAGNRYMLVLVDFATRYPEATPLKNIDAPTIAEALWKMWTRYGVPKEVLTDRGTQFTGEVMKQVCALLGIKGLTTTPYHAQGNGLVERFNATLKSMIKKLCMERPKDWDQYIDAALFSYREVPQESLGFAPFELLYGRTVRGPLAVLRDLWTKDDVSAETKTTAEYVFDLRNRIAETCEIAHDALEHARDRQAHQFNKKAVQRNFEVGDEVLLLLPEKNNKLQLVWRGPFPVVEKKGICDYRIRVKGQDKLFHANLLKKYHRREVASVAAIVIEETEVKEVSADDLDREVIQCTPEGGVVLPALVSKEGPDDVNIFEGRQAEEKEALEKLVKENRRIFTDMPLQCTLGDCPLALEPDQPVRVKQYPLPHSQESLVKDEVDAMFKAGIIERSASPFSSPILLVKKKDGSMRFCIDFRRLNKKLRFDAEPLPDVDSLFAKIGKAMFFSKLDLSKGYFQIRMREQDRCKTAFTTPAGQFQFTVMPFGLKTAGAVFSRIMRLVLQPLALDCVHNFMDDILVATEAWQSHVVALRALFRRLNEVNLSARPKKCFLGFDEISFLGHRFMKGKMKPEEDKVQRIEEASRPTTKKQLRSFLGLAGYYRRFVPNYAAIALPLTNLTKKNSPDSIPWDDQCQRAFEVLKSKLCSHPIVILPDSSRPFVLRTDASGESVGAVLMQDHGHGLQPISYASKKLSDAERRYSTIEQECYAVVFGIRRFYPYLYGRDFVVETDHHPLSFLDRIRPLSRRLTGWAMELQSHNFTVRSIPGTENVAADYMSRM